jgi:hypothetical protein
MSASADAMLDRYSEVLALWLGLLTKGFKEREP